MFNHDRRDRDADRQLTRAIDVGDIEAENEQISDLAESAAGDPAAPFGSPAWGDNREDSYANSTRRHTAQVRDSLRSDITHENSADRQHIAAQNVELERLENERATVAATAAKKARDVATLEDAARVEGHEAELAKHPSRSWKWSLLGFFVVIEAIAISAAMQLFGFSNLESYIVSGGLTLSQTVFGDYVGTTHKTKRFVDSLGENSALRIRFGSAAPNWKRARRISWSVVISLLAAGLTYGLLRAAALEDVSSGVQFLAIAALPIVAIVPGIAALTVAEYFASPLHDAYLHVEEQNQLASADLADIDNAISTARTARDQAEVRVYDRCDAAERLIDALRHRCEEKIQLYRYYFFQALDETYVNQMFPEHHGTAVLADIDGATDASLVAKLDDPLAAQRRADVSTAPEPGHEENTTASDGPLPPEESKESQAGVGDAEVRADDAPDASGATIVNIDPSTRQAPSIDQRVLDTDDEQHEITDEVQPGTDHADHERTNDRRAAP